MGKGMTPRAQRKRGIGKLIRRANAHVRPFIDFRRRVSRGRFCDYCKCDECAGKSARDDSKVSRDLSMKCADGTRICFSCMTRTCKTCLFSHDHDQPLNAGSKKMRLPQGRDFDVEIQQCPHRPRVLFIEIKRCEKKLLRDYRAHPQLTKAYNDPDRKRRSGYAFPSPNASWKSIDRELLAAPMKKPEAGSLESIVLGLSNCLSLVGRAVF